MNTCIHETTQALLQRWLGVNVFYMPYIEMDCGPFPRWRLESLKNWIILNDLLQKITWSKCFATCLTFKWLVMSLHKIDTPIHETTHTLLQRWLAVNVLTCFTWNGLCPPCSQQLYVFDCFCYWYLTLTSSDVYSIKEPFSKKLITSLIDNRWW